MSQMAVLPTAYRGPLPRGLSYPVGAEVLSTVLSDIPQFSELRLSFSGTESRCLALYSSPRELVKAGLNQESSPYRALLRASWMHGGWSLEVEAVPSPLRYAFRRVLLTGALEEARQWFLTPRADTWFEGCRDITIGADEPPTELCIVEVQGRRILGVRKRSISPESGT